MIGSDNGLSPVRRQTIIWTNGDKGCAHNNDITWESVILYRVETSVVCLDQSDTFLGLVVLSIKHARVGFGIKMSFYYQYRNFHTWKDGLYIDIFEVKLTFEMLTVRGQ